MAHISIGFRRLGSSSKLSNRSMPFYPRSLLGRWILPRNPIQRLDVLRTSQPFFISLFPRNSIPPPRRIRKSNNRREYLNPVPDDSIGHNPRRWRLFRLKPHCRPPLVGEWVVPLPLSDKGNVEACSEIHSVSPEIFLALSRDGDGQRGW